MHPFIVDNISIIAWIFIALINLGTALLTWFTKKTVEVLERSTNGMKAELVKATYDNAFLAGQENALALARKHALGVIELAEEKAEVVLEVARKRARPIK